MVPILLSFPEFFRENDPLIHDFFGTVCSHQSDTQWQPRSDLPLLYVTSRPPTNTLDLSWLDQLSGKLGEDRVFWPKAVVKMTHTSGEKWIVLIGAEHRSFPNLWVFLASRQHADRYTLLSPHQKLWFIPSGDPTYQFLILNDRCKWPWNPSNLWCHPQQKNMVSGNGLRGSRSQAVFWSTVTAVHPLAFTNLVWNFLSTNCKPP